MTLLEITNSLAKKGKFRSEYARTKYLAWYERRASNWPVSSENVMVETSQGSTFVRISGSKNARPLVLLPGGHNNSLQWIANIEMLARKYRVFTIDNILDRGLSLSNGYSWSSRFYIDWLDELFDALGLSNEVNLGGLSYGGWICSQYALARPERLNRLVLMAPAKTALTFHPMFLARTVIYLLPFRWASKQLMTWVHGDNDTIHKYRAFIDQAAESMWEGRRAFKLKRLIVPTVLSDDEWRQLGATTMTIFLVGGNEKIYSAKKAIARVERLAPQIRTQVVPNGGHLFTITHSGEVNESILKFLAGNDNEVGPV